MANRTIKQLAIEALLVQDACNLLAVVNGMSRAVKELREILPGGWDVADMHPITKLWADKVAHLSGTQTNRVMMLANAYGEVKTLAEGTRADDCAGCRDAQNGVIVQCPTHQ